MEPFVRHTGIAAPLLRINIDTDAIIPSREMKRVSKEGLGEGLFANWRYRDVASRAEEPGFVLNRAPWRQASILLAGANFGCGSSREHAVWALKDFGFLAIVAPSFGSIFHGNCVRNGIVPVELDESQVAVLAAAEEAKPGRPLTIDLENCQLVDADGSSHAFRIAEQARHLLLEGLDPIAATLAEDQHIQNFLERDRRERPWVYELPSA